MISVLMTCYNSQRYINEAIESVVKQTYKDWELIIVNDGSTDDTEAILTKHWIRQGNIVVFNNKENKGHTKSLNEGLKHCLGEYIAWMDSDDISHPKRFERQVQALSKYDLCTTHGITISERGRRVKNFYTDKAQREKKSTIHDKLKSDCWLLLPSLMFRREVFEKIGYFDEECLLAQDFNYFLRALKAGFDFCIIPEELFKFRKHSKNVRNSGRYPNKDWHKFAKERVRECPIIKNQ